MVTLIVYDGKTLAPKWPKQVARYEITTDADYLGRSQAEIAASGGVVAGDYIELRDGRETLLTGVADVPEQVAGSNRMVVHIAETPTIFSRDIFIVDESPLHDVGIEDFIVQLINDNFVDSGDPLLDIPYIRCTAETHTPIATPAVEGTSNSINLHSYIAKARLLYGVQVAAMINGPNLDVSVSIPSSDPIIIDATTSDVTAYDEVSEIDAAARAIICLQTVDRQTEQITRTYTTYYLLVDGSVSMDVNAPDRVTGRTVTAVTSTPDAVEQTAKDAFARNRYQHKITLDTRTGTQLWDVSRLVVGAPVRLWSRGGKARDTAVTGRTTRSDSAVTRLVFGNLRVSLTDKLRGDFSQ